MKKLLLSLFFMAQAFGVVAQPVAEPKEAWRAMGALFKQDREYCKVVLVTPSLALTAAHCVKEASGKVLVPGPEWLVQFPSTKRVRIKDVAIVPGYAYESLDAAPMASLNGDVAVVALENPVDVLPINLMGYSAQADFQVWVPGPKWRRCPTRPSSSPDVFHVGCGLDRGRSGEPILRIDEKGIHIVGIVTAQDPFEAGVFAHSIHAALARLEWVYGGPEREEG